MKLIFVHKDHNRRAVWCLNKFLSLTVKAVVVTFNKEKALVRDNYPGIVKLLEGSMNNITPRYNLIFSSVLRSAVVPVIQPTNRIE